MDVEKIKSEFQFIGASITSLNITNQLFQYDERRPGKKEIDVGYAIIDNQVIQEQKKRCGMLDLHVNINCTLDEKSLQIQLVMRGIFTAPAEIAADLFEKMLKINGCTALYSMARANIGSISSQIFAVGNIVLPMVNIIRFHELGALPTEKGSDTDSSCEK